MFHSFKMTSTVETDYLRLQKKILRWVGISLQDEDSVWYNIYSLMITIFMWSYVFTSFYGAFINRTHLDILLENLTYGAAALDVCGKLLATFCVRKQLGKALLLLQKGVFLPNIGRGGNTEADLIKEYIWFINGQVILLYGMMGTCILCSTVQTIIPRIYYSDPESWNLPYGKFVLLNTTYTPNFEIAGLYELTTLNVAGIGGGTVSSLIAGVMAYISYQCKILQNFIITFIEYTNRKINLVKNENRAADVELSPVPSEVQWKYLKKTVKEIVAYHTAIMDLAENFEKLLNLVALVDYIVSSLVVCIALFTANAYPTVSLRLINLLSLAVGCTFVQFITAYWGTQVITESGAVGRACYEADFINTDIRIQKSWNLIIQRSQKPIVFTVGKIAPLSMNTFQKVLQSAYTYFMMLYHFSEEKILEV